MNYLRHLTSCGLISTSLFPQVLLAEEAFVIFEYNASPNETTANSGGYLVQPGDTLARIVLQHYGNVANIHDVFVQIVAQNPQAFVGGNPNRLLSGAILNLSDSKFAPRNSRHEIYFF